MKSLTSIRELVEEGLADPADAEILAEVTRHYAMAITPPIAALIDRDDKADPIARQFVPRREELTVVSEDRADPIGDQAHAPLPGVVHRHKDRALLMPVLACPIYCRFCFRRARVGQGELLPPEALDAALAYIAEHPEIWEVVITGGDPFILSPRRIELLAARLAAIPHVKAVRWHSRVPVVDPEHITDEFAAALIHPGATAIVALHTNHARELTRSACTAIAKLIDAGIMMVSQSVLLKGVNDNADVLADLMRGLVANRVKPYYLHHTDLAQGTAHFRLTIDQGQALMRQLRARVSGLCMPTYVLDIPGGFAKVPLGEGDVEREGDNHWRIRDRDGVWHSYP